MTRLDDECLDLRLVLTSLRILGAEIGNILGTLFGAPLLAFALYYVTPVFPYVNLSPALWQAFAIATMSHVVVAALMWLDPERLKFENEVTKADRAAVSMGAVIWVLISVWLYLGR